MNVFLCILLCLLLSNCKSFMTHSFRQIPPITKSSSKILLRVEGRDYGGGGAHSEPDSVEKLAKSVERIFSLRGRYPKTDTTLPENMRTKSGAPDYQHLWNITVWDRHIQRRRYFKHFAYLPTSRILRRVAPILGVLLPWTLGAICLSRKWISIPLPTSAATLPMTTVSMFSTFIALLLTLRTNQSISRLLEGRLAWGRCVLLTRDTSQLLSTYIYPLNTQNALKAARHLSIFGWLLKCRMRDEPDSDIITSMLNPLDAKYVSRQRKHPVALITRIRQVVALEAKRGNLNPGSHRSLEANLLELNRIYGMCERLRGSPVPPMYSRHTSRLLMFWLFSLPLSLNSTPISAPINILLVMVAGFVTLGLDEISMQLEQPFRLMPMQQLAGAVMLDVADAFVERPPGLEDEEGEGEEREEPRYWKD
ncbi:hypothetical protein TrVE_jg13495 [Triparma verrucosa]|uniref:Uncharacterized protein n=1 Tax=Triparma verrucosa TaxID=1606542 RepID=A0A9W7B9Z6_9STRA|nr:hypothetical protein TrVE_jg13495 [Triparma verrucosa]